MVIAEVGEIVRVPLDITLEVDGFENTVPTKGEDGTVIQRVFRDNDGTQNIYDYQLQFPQKFDLVTESGVVAYQADTFWYTENELTGTAAATIGLPFTTRDINSSLQTSQFTTRIALRTGSAVLNKIPTSDPLFRDVSQNLVNLLEHNDNVVKQASYDPSDEQSSQDAHATASGSRLLAFDSNAIAVFLENIQIQQQTVARQTNTLQSEESQSLSNSNSSNEKNASLVNSLLDRLAQTPTPKYPNASDGYSATDWEKLNPAVPTAEDLFAPSETSQEQAARLFPLLDTTAVVASGLV